MNDYNQHQIMFRDPWQQQQQQQHHQQRQQQQQQQQQQQLQQHQKQPYDIDNHARWDYNMAVRRFSLPAQPPPPSALDSPNYMRYMDGTPSLGSDGFVVPPQPAPQHNYYDVRRMSHPAMRTAPQQSRRREDRFGDATANAVAMGMVAMAGSRPSNTPSGSDPSGASSSISYLGDTDEEERREGGMSGVAPGSGVDGQASMMSTFHSKTLSQSQKKHKCPVCWKRFTRPSSLATHILSHTGERPFSCDYDGCGRKFSVVSNLRRHKRIHAQGS